ncbi:MAG: glycoside hydrolase family 32 protein, partial [Leptospiraceae bacterium]|nr:glycoside hydrolase family 32 protein [Leptospiraceae bacterium]
MIHFTTAKNWINDPNGLIAINGVFHMYYQHNPFGNNWGLMSWGHAISRDLYSWKEEPVALHEKGYSFYPRMKFSGSAVLDSKNTSGLCKNNATCLVAIYTEWTLLNQTQNIAVSHDEGKSFVEYRGNPVIDEKSWSFRDPKVFWHGKTSKWIMAVAKPSAKKVSFYSSKNLLHWSHLSDFSAKTPTEGIWECPDLFFLPLMNDSNTGKWVLLISVAETAKGSFMQYFVGDFDGNKFTPEPSFANAKVLDYGYDFYAAISWENLAPNNRVIIGWMNNWEYANSLPTYPWKGSMSLPRKLSLGFKNGEYYIRQNPESKIEKYKERIKTIGNFHLSDQIFSIPVRDGTFEFNVEFSDITAEEIGIKLRTPGESAIVTYNQTENTILFDRKN